LNSRGKAGRAEKGSAAAAVNDDDAVGVDLASAAGEEQMRQRERIAASARASWARLGRRERTGHRRVGGRWAPKSWRGSCSGGLRAKTRT